MLLFDKMTAKVQKQRIQQPFWEQFYFALGSFSSFLKAEWQEIKGSALIKMML